MSLEGPLKDCKTNVCVFICELTEVGVGGWVFGSGWERMGAGLTELI